MNDNQNHTNPTPLSGDEQAELISARFNELAERLLHEDNADPALVLATLHAEIVLCIAARYGGQVAAERCLNAAERIGGMPSFRDHMLAHAPPAGSA
jgi:hypothetical protein